jgi:hypothetical protein
MPVRPGFDSDKALVLAAGPGLLAPTRPVRNAGLRITRSDFTDT